MQPLTLRVACRRYDRTNPILSGAVGLEGIEIRAEGWDSVPRMFAAMFRGEYDVAEMSLAELIYYTSRDASEFVGIPIFPSRIFRHGYVFCRADVGIDGPGSLKGKRIGFPRLVQTACVWIRGLLVEEYGLSPAETRWFVGGTHHWEEGPEDKPFQTPDGAVFHYLPRVTADENENLELALLDGTIDVLGTTRVPRGILAGDPRLRRLWPDPPRLEADYFKKCGVFPIMHVLVARRDVVARRPDLPVKLFDLFSRAKQAGRTWLRDDPSIALVWKNRYLAEERAFFGGDPWAYGLAPNEHVIARFLGYCDALGISARRLQPRDLFHPDTWGLAETPEA